MQPRAGDDIAAGIDDASAIPQGTLDPVYEAKARVLNRHIQEIGMGWYQWQLFIVIGKFLAGFEGSDLTEKALAGPPTTCGQSLHR